MTKYLTGKHPPEFLREISGPVGTVSRTLTNRTVVTIAKLRKSRRLWAARQGYCPMPNWTREELQAAAQLLDARREPARAP